jgi:molybdopterin biosynthesis enzyme
MPAGADAVQQVEKTRRDGDLVSFLEPVRPGQNGAPRGSQSGLL